MMVALLLILGGLLTYLLFAPDTWFAKKLDKYCTKDIEYQENVPFIPALEKKWEDPEVPYRKSKEK